jgi:aryl-alcohol dehydrogenase-like predicted oxidoreductase
MTPQQFENLRDEFLTREARILDWKREEYSPNEDRLQNFREVAALTGLRMTEVALIWLLKHIQKAEKV